MVDYDSGRLPNKSWYHRTPTKAKTLNPKYTEKNQAHWLGVHLPFETLALRIRWVELFWGASATHRQHPGSVQVLA